MSGVKNYLDKKRNKIAGIKQLFPEAQSRDKTLFLRLLLNLSHAQLSTEAMEGSGNVEEAELGCSVSTSVSSSILAPSACSRASRVSREALLDCLSAKAQEGHKMTAGSK